MEVAGAAVGAVLGPICNLLCGCVSSKMTTTLNLPSNLDVLVKDMKSLVDRRVYVKNEKEAAEKEGKEILGEVVTWLEDVEKLELKVNPIQEEMVNKKKPSACFLNCNKRYRESRKWKKYWKRSKGFYKLEFSQTDIGTIGIWGLGGVGKTTLGLPLAIITSGSGYEKKGQRSSCGMHTLKQLGRSVPSIEGIEAEVYKPLKWSYDSLQDTREGTVKMHDVVRDVAIWIASSSEDGWQNLTPDLVVPNLRTLRIEVSLPNLRTPARLVSRLDGSDLGSEARWLGFWLGGFDLGLAWSDHDSMVRITAQWLRGSDLEMVLARDLSSATGQANCGSEDDVARIYWWLRVRRVDRIVGTPTGTWRRILTLIVPIFSALCRSSADIPIYGFLFVDRCLNAVDLELAQISWLNSAWLISRLDGSDLGSKARWLGFWLEDFNLGLAWSDHGSMAQITAQWLKGSDLEMVLARDLSSVARWLGSISAHQNIYPTNDFWGGISGGKNEVMWPFFESLHGDGRSVICGSGVAEGNQEICSARGVLVRGRSEAGGLGGAWEILEICLNLQDARGGAFIVRMDSGSRRFPELLMFY
uniref:Uncharacterized protein n=1 Tax=Fagus sylvatica TaxID=28930 RepID=A0A2N9J3X1_FAGSY